MLDMEQAVKEIMSKIWERGRELGMSDEDIVKLIEKTLADGIKIPARVSPTGEDTTYHYIQQTRQPLYAPPTVTQQTIVRKEEPVVNPGPVIPQPVYAPKTSEEYVVTPPQPVYAPPTAEELHEMIKDETTGNGDQPKRI